MRSFVVALALATLVPVAAEAADPCWGSYNVRIVEDLVADAQLTVGGGRACGLKLGAVLTTVDRIEVTRKPAHGTLTVDRTYVAYRAAKGYAGPDSFGFAYVGQNRWGKPSRTGLNVAVTVTR
jgi:hypothetical protein